MLVYKSKLHVHLGNKYLLKLIPITLILGLFSDKLSEAKYFPVDGASHSLSTYLNL